MDLNGFFGPYPVGRPLTDKEREHRLSQKQRLGVKEGDDLSVIRFNSTYMEVVDKWFAWRGIAAMIGCVFSSLILFFLVALLVTTLSTPERFSNDWPFLAVMLAMASPLLAFIWLMLIKKDISRFTHYPIRLNRKIQTLHVFRTDGTVLSAPWREIFFCIADLQKGNCEIQGHVLDKDGVTVKETFAFPVTGTGAADRDQLPRYWEFVRRYMEEGPGSVAERVEYCLPIAERREGFTDGFHRMHGQAHALFAPILIVVLFFLYVLPYPGRWLTMRTSKLPVWPKEIDDVCVIEPNDPFRKDASTNKPITDHSLVYIVVVIGIALLYWVWKKLL